MKKFMALVLTVVIIAMASSFVGVIFANMVLAKNNEHSTQLVVVEATATPSATAEATVTVEPTATPIAEPTATPIIEATATPIVEATATPTVEPTIEQTATVEPTSKDQSEISWDDFFAKSRYVDGSFNAIYDGQEVGRINFTDEDLMAHVGEELAINVASTSVSVKLEGKRHVYKAASVQQPDLAVCSKHTALYRRHTSAYGDDIVITLTAEDITNIAKYAAYWYNSDGELTYGLTICDCFVGKHSYTSSSGGDYDHSSDEPTAAPTQEPQPTAEPTNSNTPQPPKDEATNNPNHNDQPQEPQPATKNTPVAPAQDYVGENNTQHNEQLNAANGTEESDGNPSHSDLLGAEEVSEGTASAVADTVSAPEAPSEDMVAIISSQAEESESSSTQEVPDPVVEAVTDASNTTAHGDMPTE